MIDNTEDVIDSRDVIARIDELKAEWTDATDGEDPDLYALSEDDWSVGLGWDGAAEIVALLELAEQGKSLADWEYGETLIRDDYFPQYAQELAEDIGAIDTSATYTSWPLQYIDWDRAADALLMDYTTVEFDGVTYWARG
jgi:hypothetical protein